MAVAIVTANFGGFDAVREQARQDVDVDWVCFTDDAELRAPGWDLAIEAPHGDPRMQAKRHKLMPSLPHEQVIWIDANMQITSASFAREALAWVHDGIALYSHPRRDCIYEEAHASLVTESQGGKYDSEPIAEQTAHYRSEGHPEHWGLWAAGVIAWDFNHWQAQCIGSAWWWECKRWSVQDQLSFPVVCRRGDVTPGTFDHPQIESRENGYLANRWVRIHPHL